MVGKHDCRRLKWLGAWHHTQEAERQTLVLSSLSFPLVQDSSLGVSSPSVVNPSRACPEVCLLSETRSVRLVITIGPHKVLRWNLRILSPSEIRLPTTFSPWLTRRERSASPCSPGLVPPLSCPHSAGVGSRGVLQKEEYLWVRAACQE